MFAVIEGSPTWKSFRLFFEGIENPLRSNTARHDLADMLTIGLLSTLCGGEGCCDMALFGRSKEAFLRRIALELARAQSSEGSMRGKLECAAWQDEFMFDLVQAAIPDRKRLP